MRILILGKDTSVERCLQSHQMNVYRTDEGEEAADLMTLYDYDLAILHHSEDDMSPRQVVTYVRDRRVKTPIMFVQPRLDRDQMVELLMRHVDDVMVAPVDDRELTARVQTIVRRCRGHACSVMTFGSLTLNFDTKQVTVGGTRVHLTSREYQMMELLCLRKNHTLTKENFMNHLYGGMNEPELKIIDVFVCKLRKKLQQAGINSPLIETVWGRGYRIAEDDS